MQNARNCSRPGANQRFTAACIDESTEKSADYADCTDFYSTKFAVIRENSLLFSVKSLIELLEERKPEFQELFIEALEDVALANAIREGRRDEFVSEDEIRAALERL